MVDLYLQTLQVYENIMMYLDDEPLLVEGSRGQTYPARGGRTPKSCTKWSELEGICLKLTVS